MKQHINLATTIRVLVVLAAAAAIMLLLPNYAEASSHACTPAEGPFCGVKRLGNSLYGYMKVVVIPLALVVGGYGLLKALVLDMHKKNAGGGGGHAAGMQMMAGSLIIVIAMLFWGAIIGLSETVGTGVNTEFCNSITDASSSKPGCPPK